MKMSPKLVWLGVFLLSSFTALVQAQYNNFGPGYGYGSQQPIIVRNSDDDGLRNILPLLLILLLTDGYGGYGGGFGGGGYGNYGGGGCNCGGCNNGCGCGNPIPIPYPIPVSCSCPIITS